MASTDANWVRTISKETLQQRNRVVADIVTALVLVVSRGQTTFACYAGELQGGLKDGANTVWNIYGVVRIRHLVRRGLTIRNSQET